MQGSSESPKPAQQGLMTAEARSEAVCTAGEAKQSPYGSSQDEGIQNVLFTTPACAESEQEAEDWVLGMGMSANDFW